MSYIILAVLILGLIIMVIGFFRSGAKEFKPKLSIRERTELEKKIETKKIIEPTTKPVQPKQSHPIKNSFPSKDIRDEINRFKTFFDIENDKLTQYIRSGIQKSQNQNYKSALEDFSQAVESKPFESVAHYCRGLTKLSLKNYESAASDFTETIRLQMKEPNALYYRGLANFGAKDLDHAIRDLTSYTNAEDNFDEAYFNLAICYKQKGDFENAIHFLNITIEKNPHHEVAYFERGLLKNKIDDKNGCCADLKKAMDMGHLESYHYIKELCDGRN
jgi:tetratricopeptide (TPR) repeat protein